MKLRTIRWRPALTLSIAGTVALTGVSLQPIAAEAITKPATSVAQSALSPTAKRAKAKKVSPLKIARIRAASRSANRITVRWSGAKAGRKYWVVAASDPRRIVARPRANSLAWRSKAYSAGRRVATITIPAAKRARVGSHTGNPVFVRVYTQGKTRKLGVSPIATVLAKPPAVKGKKSQRVTFATYNVLAPTLTARKPTRTWERRRAAVVNAIRRASPDVLAVQEISTAWLPNGRRQVEDLAELLRPHGYALAVPLEKVLAARTNGSSMGSHLFYRTSRIQKLDSGVQLLRSLNPTLRWSLSGGEESSNPNVPWGVFRSKASGATFVAAGIHLRMGHDSASVRIRTGSITGVNNFVTAKAAGRPAVIMGDFNSYIWSYPNGPDTYLMARGWRSAAASSKRYAVQYTTANDRSGGFPAKPATSMLKKAGMRIDQIMVKGGSGSYSYANQVVLSRSGRFIERYRGSDHNLQKAVVSIR